jgi:hypothetical protein
LRVVWKNDSEVKTRQPQNVGECSAASGTSSLGRATWRFRNIERFEQGGFVMGMIGTPTVTDWEQWRSYSVRAT